MADIGIKALEAATQYRVGVGNFLKVYKELLSLDKEYIAINVSGNLPLDAFADITNTEFTDGVGAIQTIQAAIVTNQTNLYKLSDGGHR